MERRRRTWLLLLVVGLTSMAVMAAVAPGAATDPASAPGIAAAGETSCSSCLKCPCGCSPLAGAWAAKLSSPIETVVQTFKFAPINDGCTKFVVNSQASTRSAQVAKFWPDACDLTEFVGIACKDVWKDMKFTAIGYGVKRCDGVDEVVFIAIMTGKVEIPESCLECGSTGGGSSDSKDAGTDAPCPATDTNDTGGCYEPDELKATIYVSYFDAAQDQDRDGLPDCPCEEAVICVCFETCLKRVKLMEPCEESRSFVACLEKCKDANTPATGRAFIRILEEEQKICFVLTVKNIRDVTRATIQVNGVEVVTLFPFSSMKYKDGDCHGLLSCGCFYVKDCTGSWKGKKFEEIVKAMEEGQATVVVCTKKCSKGEICGKIEDP